MTAINKTIILDNGAYRIKAGYATDKEPKIIPNSIVKSKLERKRIYVADELDECADKSSLYFVLPFERGYLVNWDVELQIWDRIFSRDVFNVDFRETNLLLTDPNDIAKAVRDVSAEIAFETYQFDTFLRTSAPSSVAYAHYLKNYERPENSCCLIVDSGYSFTHIVPFIDGKIVKNGVIRIDVGGKILTNQLKEWISYRQLNVLEETYVMNQCKEDICFVSTNFQADIQKCLTGSQIGTLKKNYILPDFVNFHRGIVQSFENQNNEVDDCAKIKLGVERFATPEILFNPSDIDINQMGIVDAIHCSLNRLPEEIQCLLLKNIILIGGNAKFENFKERITQDLRPLISNYFDFNIYLPPDPISHAWKSAAKLISNTELNCNDFKDKFITRTEYMEKGSSISQNKFNNYFLFD